MDAYIMDDAYYGLQVSKQRFKRRIAVVGRTWRRLLASSFHRKDVDTHPTSPLFARFDMSDLSPS